MRVVLALLAMEVALAIARPAATARARGWTAAILRHKALQAGPRLNQRAIDREVLARQQLAHLRQVQHGDKKLGRDIAVEQPIPVLAEHGRIPHGIIHREAYEPAEQQIVVELLHQLPFRANREERLQQQRPQQPLGRDRRPTLARVELAKVTRQVPQRRVDQIANGPQRMIGRNALFQPHVAEYPFRSLIFSAHRMPQPKGIRHMHGITLRTPRQSPFSAAC